MKTSHRKGLLLGSLFMTCLCGAHQNLLAQTTATGPSTSQTPYLQPLASGYKMTSILSANDSIGGYPMAGTPDGLGAFDNQDGTFTLLMNHEFVNTVGAVRAHGSKGSFISKWIIRKSDLTVLSGSDLIQNVNLWNGSGYTTYNAGNPSASAAFSRFCSADLALPDAFYNNASGLGTQERIFMNGEESGTEGRAMAHIATGPNAGNSYELAWFGKMAWENVVANAHAQDKTIVAGMDDGTGGQVYFYVGAKTNSGLEIDKAGLTNGKLYGIAVSGFALERANSTSIGNPPAPGTRFSLVDMGDVKSITGASLNTNSVSLGVTSFSRPEDGAWDPSNPNDFYFNTTDQIDQVNDGVGSQVGRSRVWRLRFDDIAQPELGGTIEAVLDGTEGQNMLDNMTIDKYGHITLLEDVGNSAHNGKIWLYDIASDQIKMIGKHDPARFGDISVAATSPFNQDEETSGVIDVQEILGPGMYLIVDQAHYATGLPLDIVEGGQLLAIYNPDTYRSYAFSEGAGPSTLQTPYLVSADPKVSFESILSANDSIGGYPMVGVPDGLGAYDNGDGTFTLLMNHELLSSEGAVRAHGSIGSFVSKWIIRKSDLTVLSGADLMQNIKLWNGTGYDTYNAGNPSALAAFNRFCSADLPATTAFYNGVSGLGSQARIFMNGEEFSEGRAMAHVATGNEAGTSYQLPWFGKLAWENAVANPYAQDKTIVGGMDDASITTGNVYFYVGTKTNTGNEIDKAGLNNGKLYGVKVAGFAKERNSSTSINNAPAPGTHFDLVDIGDVTNLTGTQLDAASATAGATYFARPEDGAWDPSSPADFYFNTTDQLDQVNDGIGTQIGRSRTWHLHFADITHPELGGTIEAVLDGTEGQNMMDNMAIDKFGHIILLEDVGNAAHNGKIWQYDIKTDSLKMIGKHDPARFGDVGLGATAPFTQDEETSGVIDVQNILGPGMYLIVDQAHYKTGIPSDVVEGGQLLAMHNCPASYSFDTVTACLDYSWNGQKYTSSGVYTYTTTNTAGCDSIATLVLTIIQQPKPQKPFILADGVTTGACPGQVTTLTTGTYPAYKWSTGETTQSIQVTNSGVYNVTITAPNGCERTSATLKVVYDTRCISPKGLASAGITATSATVSWKEVNCSKGYVLQYRKIGEISFKEVNISSGSTTQYNLANLSPNSTYEWEIANICNDDPVTLSSYSNPKLVRTGVATFSAAVSSSAVADGGLHIAVTPNPATTVAKLTVTGATTSMTVRLTDLTGRLLWHVDAGKTNNISIPVAGLSPGTYIISVQSGSKLMNTQLVVNR